MQVNPLRATGYLPFGLGWPFEVGKKEQVVYDAENSDDDYDDTPEEKHVDETRNLLWHIILENVSCEPSDCMNAILELSDPSIFMMLGVSNVKMVNDLISMDYLTDGNSAFNLYGASVSATRLQEEATGLCPAYAAANGHGS